MAPTNDRDKPAGELKVVAEGSHSMISTSFVAVVRDAETYAALRGLAGNIPELDAAFFKSNVVVAAFLGTRNTGGYSVDISREAGQIRVAEKAPGKDMMVTQVITSPFKLVSVATTGTPPVQISLDERFMQNAQLYRINNGSFTMSGGFAGRRETYQLAGKLQVMRLGNLVSVGFAVLSSGTQRERTLREFATGTVTVDAFSVSRMSHGSLLDQPSGDFHAEGKFAEKNKLTLNLDSGPVTVPDGYSGKGSFEAELVASPRSP